MAKQVRLSESLLEIDGDYITLENDIRYAEGHLIWLTRDDVQVLYDAVFMPRNPPKADTVKKEILLGLEKG